MSAISHKEVEATVDEIEGADDLLFSALHDRRKAIYACERVAALVEERMKERVCSVCGEVHPPGKCVEATVLIGGEPWEFDSPTCTRAQFEAEREG